MGGGRGTRLYPLTKERCKPAVPLAGKYRLVDIPISNCLNSGLNQIHILTQFNTASLHNHIQNTYQFDAFGGGYVDILSAEQTEYGDSWYQGTADAVRQNLHHFHAQDEDLYLILSGDQLYRMDFRKIIRQHLDKGADITIAAKPVLKSQVTGLGVMKVDENLAIQSFAEKPTEESVINSLVIPRELHHLLRDPADEDYCLASMGIYVFNGKTLHEGLGNDMKDFGKEIIPSMLGQKGLYAHIFDEYWEDIGTVASFFEANLALTDDIPPFNFFDHRNPVFTRARYLPACKLNSCSIDHAISAGGVIVVEAKLKRTVLGVRSVVDAGTTLENVVMMGADFMESPEDRAKNRELGRPHVGVGRNCMIRNAIIDKNARIGHNVVLKPDGKEEHWTDGGIYVRDGIVCVTKGSTVPDGYEM